jgi:hypothetical protein
MVNTKILLSVVIVLLIGVAAATYHVTTTTPGFWQPTTSQDNQKSTDQGTSTPSEGSQTQTQSGTTSTVSQDANSNGGSTVDISATKAKVIAQKYIEQDGATAGTPILKKMNGKQTYIVPVNMNGKQVGEIWIDAQTGENIGGAGGAP